jgi:5-hydroxyisourate hydrolase
MTGLSTHVLDLSTGRPASGIAVTLFRRKDAEWHELGVHKSGADGRVNELLPPGEDLQRSIYMLRFETGAYYQALDIESFHPLVEITFQVRDPGEHYHIPLLLAPHSYSTYRGS